MQEKNEDIVVKPGEEVEVEAEIDPEFSLMVEVNPADVHEEEEVNDTPYHEDDFSDDSSSEEDEERYQVHLQKKKSDKIFNNSYNTGDGYGADEQSFRSDIKISQSHSDSHLHDPQRYREHLDNSIVQSDIHAFIRQCSEIQEILSIDPSRKKFSKQELNYIFLRIKEGLERGDGKSSFISYIYILDAISSVTTLEYKKIFDSLEYEYKECLLLELNQKYNILGHSNRSKKLF
jgi:hypothetical protein